MDNLILIIVFLLVFIIFFYGMGQNTEKYCNIKDEYRTHALMASNIPVDPQTKYMIGGKYNKPIQDESLAPTEGKYIFPIAELMYDGIWKSDAKIDGNVETQKWLMNTSGCNPQEGKYATNKFFHVPEKKMLPGEEIVGEPVYYGDWNILEIKDRNSHSYDVCDFGKSKDHKHGIHYLPPGVRELCINYP